MAPRMLQQFHFTVYCIIYMIDVFFYSSTTAWDFSYVVSESEKGVANNLK